MLYGRFTSYDLPLGLHSSMAKDCFSMGNAPDILRGREQDAWNDQAFSGQ